MTHWTKPEHYTPQALAWQVAKEWLRRGPISPTAPQGWQRELRGREIDGRWINESAMIPDSWMRQRFEYGGRRSGKTASMGFDVSSEPDRTAYFYRSPDGTFHRAENFQPPRPKRRWILD